MDKNNLYRNVLSTAHDLAQLYDHQEINLSTLANRLAASHQEIIDVRCMVLAGQLYFTKANRGVLETKRFSISDFETEKELAGALAKWVYTK
jgi:hypothetical protein